MFLQRSLLSSGFVTEAAGVGIIMTAPTDQETEVFVNSSPRERVVLPSFVDDDDKDGGSDKERKSCGFHLTRSKWDPYPWVGFVEPGSIAHAAGLRWNTVYVVCISFVRIMEIPIPRSL